MLAKSLYALTTSLAVLCGCLAREGDFGADASDLTATTGATAASLELGAQLDASRTRVRFAVYSARASRIEVWIYAAPTGAAEVARYLCDRDASGVWSAMVPVADLEAKGVGVVYYGYRAWGPNWAFDPSWSPGSLAGFVADVDGDGNRFDPNKLLLDPYALEVSHDPPSDWSAFGTGPQHRAKDSAPLAPKGIVLPSRSYAIGQKPSRPFKDEVIYEVHVRGLTMNDPSMPADLRGTYAGAARKADYLASIGVTAVELLPVHETPNDGNDDEPSTTGDNYWGYMSLSYFAPDRRYAADKSPGGPTRELAAMVRAFHDAGIKVYLDVVYNHTAEGGLWDASGDTTALLSWRGLDNATYYELSGNRFYYDNTGIGHNFNTANDVARDQIVDSLWYYSAVLGVDGFRFDLASVLGNRCQRDCFDFDKMDPDNALNRVVSEVGVRPADGGSGVDLIAEPWAIGGNSYQVGGFPAGWAEWNGKFRDTFRKDQNKLGIESVTPGELATRFAGSSDLFQDDGRRPWHSVNFMVSHDGFSLRDLYAYNQKNNQQSWPYGPSDGGEDHNVSWDQGGSAALQRQAARNGLAFLMLSAGVPMITGGDEMSRTQYGNNNAYNLDSSKNWLDWSDRTAHALFFDYARRIMRFRGAHPALRPASFFEGKDHDGDGLADITWLRDDGQPADGGYMQSPSMHFLAYRIDASELGDTAASIYVAYNGWSGAVTVRLPWNLPGKSWYRAGDTAGWMESRGNFVEPGEEEPMSGPIYELAGRSVLVLIER
jgi:glycogen operon protein